MTIAAGARLGPYEIVATIGAGGMGEVWRARDTRLGRDVAIKVLPAEFAEDAERLRRFEREAKATAALSHPNILDVHDVGTFEGVPYLVEELLEGESLKDRLERGALPTREASAIALQIAHGLAVAHEKHIVHRDLKPGNVFLTKDGIAKILDFGLAKLVEGVPVGEADTLTHAPTGATEFGRVLGTVAYMAPEQARGLPVDSRADVFAFGVVLYEMVAGERPFRGATATDTIAAILKEAPPALPSSVPAGLVELIQKCLAKEPEKRYQGGSEVLDALEAVQPEAVAPVWVSLRRSVRRHPWLAVANAVIALVALALVFDVGGVRGRLPGGSSARAVRLAVLPFANLSGDPQQEYLSDGLTQEMIAQLGRLHPASLSVIARTSVMRYKKTEAPIDRIGRELGVDYVLEGSAQREAGRIRISAELIQVRGQTQLWADVYERELSGILALQSDVAQKVAGALALKLLPAEQARLTNVRAVNPEAYDAYLKGSQNWIKLTKPDLDTAEQYFDLALSRDPGYAAAYAGLALVWACRQQMGYAPPSEAGPKAKAAARRALALDDSVAEAHFALAGVLTWTDWDFPGAGREWVRAVELNPNSPDALASYSHYLMIVGRPDEAMAQIRKALELDPFNVIVRTFYAVDLYCARRYDDAIVEARRGLRTQPDAPLALAALMWSLHEKKQYEEVIATAARYYAPWMPDVKEALERGYTETGYVGAWRKATEDEAAKHGGEPGVANELAQTCAMLGDKACALDWLERASEARDPNVPYITCFPMFDSLRSEPRFQALLRRMNLPAT